MSSLRPISFSDPRYKCLCGLIHVVTATQICLALYVAASVFSVIFGSKDLLTWLLVPLFVVSLSAYAFTTERHKYLYPFLIITIVHQFVSLIMAFIVICFAIINFDSLKKIIAHSLGSKELPSVSLSLSILSLTVLICVVVAIFHVWQAVVIYRCLEFYEDRGSPLEGSPSSRWRDDEATDWTIERECRTGAV
ncbi:hypothetical protein PMAYCL1PPCAC_18106 [Pristionchus mayeri]|uniref:Uncharacterized protein n=1 Tax=Pristionchus mayeri TaxID=1317129 RepID=A0AAN5I1Q3_9BILA|nr:hypothetical protein PMAYCL1PPCAC_18106 [Pristionchus mayeri]